MEGQSNGIEPLNCRIWHYLQVDGIKNELNCRTAIWHCRIAWCGQNSYTAGVRRVRVWQWCESTGNTQKKKDLGFPPQDKAPCWFSLTPPWCLLQGKHTSLAPTGAPAILANLCLFTAPTSRAGQAGCLRWDVLLCDSQMQKHRSSFWVVLLSLFSAGSRWVSDSLSYPQNIYTRFSALWTRMVVLRPQQPFSSKIFLRFLSLVPKWDFPYSGGGWQIKESCNLFISISFRNLHLAPHFEMFVESCLLNLGDSWKLRLNISASFFIFVFKQYLSW